MRIIGHEQVKLQPPAQEELDRTYERLREIHGDAFGWDPPAVSGLERLPSNRMRQYVRTWINEWDLRRLDPSYEPEIEAATLEVDLSEDAELEGGEAEIEGDPLGDGEILGRPERTDQADLEVDDGSGHSLANDQGSWSRDRTGEHYTE